MPNTLFLLCASMLVVIVLNELMLNFTVKKYQHLFTEIHRRKLAKMRRSNAVMVCVIFAIILSYWLLVPIFPKLLLPLKDFLK